MIQFFRIMRQRLLSENKFSKYLMYAIGEIVLVVIGILIALQINNANELRKERIAEIKMLHNFKKSITEDLLSTEDFINRFEQADESIYLILTHMENDLKYHDSLQYHFRYTTALWSPKINQEYFERTTSSDFNIITNDSLKNELLDYYSFAKRTFDVRMNRYAVLMDDASRNVFNSRFNAFWNNTWNDPDYPESTARDMKPMDYEALKKDSEYRYFLQTLKNQLYWYVREPLTQANQSAEKLIGLIDAELKSVEE